MFDRLHPPGDRARLPNHLYFFGFSALQQSELFAGCDEVLRFLLFCLPISMSLDLFRISDFGFPALPGCVLCGSTAPRPWRRALAGWQQQADGKIGRLPFNAIPEQWRAHGHQASA
jgi:hypothetical protein